MSSITPPADDLGVQSLQHDNKANTDVESVSRIAAKRAIHQSADTTLANSLSVQRRLIERRPGDRRRKDRRRRNQSVLLDTRSQHDRRINERRCSGKKNSAGGKFPHKRGVNIKV